MVVVGENDTVMYDMNVFWNVIWSVGRFWAGSDVKFSEIALFVLCFGVNSVDGGDALRTSCKGTFVCAVRGWVAAVVTHPCRGQS